MNRIPDTERLSLITKHVRLLDRALLPGSWQRMAYKVCVAVYVAYSAFASKLDSVRSNLNHSILKRSETKAADK